MRKKTLNGVASMRERRLELSRVHVRLSAEQIEEQIQQTLTDNPLWPTFSRGQPR